MPRVANYVHTSNSGTYISRTHIFTDAHLIRYEQERYDRRCALDLVFYIWNCKEGKKVYKAFLLGILKSCIFSIISNISTTLVHFNTNISHSDIVKWTSTNFLTQLRPGLLQKFASARNSSVWPFGFLLSASKLRFTIRTLFTNIVDLSRGSRNEQIVLWRLQTRLLWVNAACVPASGSSHSLVRAAILRARITRAIWIWIWQGEANIEIFLTAILVLILKFINVLFNFLHLDGFIYRSSIVLPLSYFAALFSQKLWSARRIYHRYFAKNIIPGPTFNGRA